MITFDISKIHKLFFNHQQYNFAKAITNIINVEYDLLDQIHRIIPSQELTPELFRNITSDQNFHAIYVSFIKNVLKTQFGFSRIVYQKYPNIQFYFSGYHRLHQSHFSIKQNDSNTINILIPCTNAYDTNTIWFETESNTGILQPQNLTYGEYIAFCQQKIIRDIQRNTTRHSSVFIEFSITSYHAYKETINSLILDPSVDII